MTDVGRSERPAPHFQPVSEVPASERPPIFVGVALSEREAVAIEAASMAVFTGASVDLGSEHPLMTGALKIRDALKKARDDV